MTTKLHFIADTKIAPKSTEEETRVTGVLKQLFSQFNSRVGFAELIRPHITGSRGGMKAKVLSWAVERGSRYSRIHMHIVLQITHNGKFSLTSEIDGLNITPRFKDWLMERLPWLKPNSEYTREHTTPYVRVNLADSSAENYTTKNRDDGDDTDSD